MNFLFLGDIVGRAGRNIIIEKLESIKQQYEIDFVIANGENSAGGYGITEEICNQLYEAGVDVITSGNHIWDQKETMNHIIKENRLLRPMNFQEGTPGRGFEVYEKNGFKVGVMNLMGNVYMKKCEDVFPFIQEKIKKINLKKEVDFLAVDFHAEITSEKQAIGHLLDGKATFVVGTHTHTPTLDFRILEHGTAYQTDAGMCGDYNSVIGMNKENAILKFFKRKTDRLIPVIKNPTISGIKVIADDKTGLAKDIEPIMIGGNLKFSKN